jgi:hypothetical protein
MYSIENVLEIFTKMCSYPYSVIDGGLVHQLYRRKQVLLLWGPCFFGGRGRVGEWGSGLVHKGKSWGLLCWKDSGQNLWSILGRGLEEA